MTAQRTACKALTLKLIGPYTLHACCEDPLPLGCTCDAARSPDNAVHCEEQTGGAAHSCQDAADRRRYFRRRGTCSETCQSVEACGDHQKVSRTPAMCAHE